MSGKKRKTNISVKNKQGKLNKYEKEQNKKVERAFCVSLEPFRAK